MENSRNKEFFKMTVVEDKESGNNTLEGLLKRRIAECESLKAEKVALVSSLNDQVKDLDKVLEELNGLLKEYYRAEGEDPDLKAAYLNDRIN